MKRRTQMKRFLKIRSLMLTVILLLGTLPVAAIDRPVQIERPFALNGSGLAAFITDEAGNVIGANVTASGTATHLGLWTAVGNVRFTPDPITGQLRSEGMATLTAANGDKLEVVLEGSLDPATNTDQGVFHFVGGTGRFDDVSGSAAFVVTINPLSGGFEMTMVGKIRY
jgi:hypothetical protein